MINYTMVLTVNGTQKSERAGGLDADESSTFTTKPGEYRGDLETVEDLIGSIEQSAYMRGEWISSLKLDGHDLIEEHVARILQEHQLDAEKTAIALSQMGMFAAADLGDLIELVETIKSVRLNSSSDDDDAE